MNEEDSEGTLNTFLFYDAGVGMKKTSFKVRYKRTTSSIDQPD